MASVVGNSGYAASLPFQAQSGVMFDGKNIIANFYDDPTGATARTPSISVADTADMVFTQQDHVRSSPAQTITRGYHFTSWYGYRATYGMMVFWDGEQLNGGYLNDDTNVQAAYPGTGLGYGTVTGFDAGKAVSVIIDSTDRPWCAGSDATSLKVARCTNAYNLTPQDTIITIRTNNSQSSMPQLISFENGCVGLVSAMNHNMTVYYDEWDADGNRTVTDEVVTTDISSWAYTRAVATRDNQIFLLWRSSSTTSDLKYSVRDTTGVSGTWSVAAAAKGDIDGTAGNFTSCANYGTDDEVHVFYFDGTDIQHFSWTSVGGITTNDTFVAAPSLLSTGMCAPYFDSALIPVIYHLTGGDIMCETYTLAQTTVNSPDKTVVSKQGHNYQATAGTDIQSFSFGGKNLHLYMGRDNIAYAVYEDAGVFSTPIKWSKRFWDLHNTITGTVNSDGYVYTAVGGRNAGMVNYIVIKKSNYPLNHASFEGDLDPSNWTDVSPTNITGRGYKALMVDDDDTLYLIYGNAVDSYTILERRGGTWAAGQQIIDTSTFGANHAYFDAFVLDDDPTQSIHLFWSYHDDTLTPGIPGGLILQDELFYINILPDGDGTFTLRESDKTTTIASPATHLTSEVVYSDDANFYTALGGGVINLADGTPMLAIARRSASTPYATTSMGVWTVSAGVWSYDELQTTGFPHYTVPRIVSGAGGTFVTSSDESSGVVELISYLSKDAGVSWETARAETSGSSFDNYYAVPSPRDADENNLLFHSRISRNYSELIFSTLSLLELSASEIDSTGCLLTFTPYTEVDTATNVEIHRSATSPVAGDGTTLISDGETGTTYHDETANAGATYYYVVVYKNVGDTEVARSAETSITTSSTTGADTPYNICRSICCSICRSI